MPTVPSTTTLLADFATTANPVFQDLYPILTLIVGLILAAAFFLLIVAGVRMFLSHFHLGS